MGTNLRSIMQHGYVVTDVTRTASQWAKRMGVGPFYVIDQRIDDYQYRGKAMPLELRIGVSYWRDIQLELIQPLAGETFYNHALKSSPERLNHHAVLVPDINAAVLDLQLQAFVVHTGSLPGIKFLYLEGYLPDGLTLELIQADERARYSFEAIETICRHWNGEHPVRTHADLAADIAALGRPAG